MKKNMFREQISGKRCLKPMSKTDDLQFKMAAVTAMHTIKANERIEDVSLQ